MMWRPRLVVRFTKGGGVLSPTSTAGYVLLGVAALALTLVCARAAVRGVWVTLAGLVITGALLREVWAWFAATPQEREGFRQEVALRGRAPLQARLGEDWAPWVPLALAAALGASIALTLVHPIFILAAQVTAVLLILATLDRVRAVLRRRRRASPPRE
jgi:hypothetical protein